MLRRGPHTPVPRPTPTHSGREHVSQREFQQTMLQSGAVGAATKGVGCCCGVDEVMGGVAFGGAGGGRVGGCGGGGGDGVDVVTTDAGAAAVGTTVGVGAAQAGAPRRTYESRISSNWGGGSRRRSSEPPAGDAKRATISQSTASAFACICTGSGGEGRGRTTMGRTRR